MKFEPCKLYKEVEGYDKYGRPLNHYDLVGTIDVCINTNRIYKTIGNEIYTITEPTGITPSNGYVMGESYKIEQNDILYEVDSFQPSNRFTVLYLKATNKKLVYLNGNYYLDGTIDMSGVIR